MNGSLRGRITLTRRSTLKTKIEIQQFEVMLYKPRFEARRSKTEDWLKETEIPNTKRIWCALYTRPRFEKKVYELLLNRNLCVFLPLRKEMRIWSNNRRRTISEPLFNSYVFLNGNAKEQYQALRTYGVARLVTFNGKVAEIPAVQIENIKLILTHGFLPEPHEVINIGDEVEITAGPLKGVSGRFIETRGKEKLIITLKAINQAVAIEIDRRKIRKIPESKSKLANVSC